jgi:hypothetical protein
MLEYRELRIRISRSNGGYRTYAEGPSGNASGQFVPPYSPGELDDLLREISDQVVRARSRKMETPDTASVRHFGAVLFDALIDNEIRDLYYRSLQAAEDQRKGLRITLSLKDAPELMLVPWEYLYDEPSFLATSDFTPIVRYLDLTRTREPIEVERPLRILGMVSSPSGVAELDVEREIENIDRALARLTAEGAVDVTWLDNATLDELQRCLRGGPYHVFHYIGHGEYDEDQEESVLLFEDERGRPDSVSGENLGATLANHPTLRLAALNSCEGGRTADDDPFAGVATGLLERQIPAVIAMQFEITDRMASVFSQWLYESLAAGFPVDRALSQARLAIFNRRRGVEWGTPVLFMRVQDGRIFEVPEAPALAPPPPPPPPTDAEFDDGPLEDTSADEVLPWWRQRIAAIVAAVLVTLLAVAAGAYALTRGPSPSPDLWSEGASIPNMKRILGVAAQGDEAFAGGVSSGRPAVRHYALESWSDEQVVGGTGVMKALSLSGNVAVAGGRVVNVKGDVDAGIWRRTGEGSWLRTCSDEICGDAVRGSVIGGQRIFALNVTRNGTFVAVGRESPRGGASARPAIWLSRNGASWTRSADSALTTSGDYLTGVAASGEKIVVIGNTGPDGAVWISGDAGSHWTKIAAAGLAAEGKRVEPQSVTLSSTGSGFVAVGREHLLASARWSPVAWFSADGRSWTRAKIERSGPGQQMFGVTHTQKELIAVGTDQVNKRAAAWSSSDGRTWSPMTSASFAGTGQPGMSSVATLADQTVIAVGSDLSGGRVWMYKPS